MTSDTFQGTERRRFPALLGVGIALSAVALVAAFLADAEYGWPLLVLLAICVVGAVGFRLIAGAHRDDGDETDSLPRQPATLSRPLGDTPEAHDEITAHDVPRDSPERHAVEREDGVRP
jgi:hypothetical protein